MSLEKYKPTEAEIEKTGERMNAVEKNISQKREDLFNSMAKAGIKGRLELEKKNHIKVGPEK